MKKSFLCVVAIIAALSFNSCKKEAIIPATPEPTPTDKSVDSAKISFLGDVSLGQIYSFEVNLAVSDTLNVLGSSELTVSDSTDIGCGNSLDIEIGKRYVFGYKNTSGDFIYFGGGSSYIFNASNNGSPVLDPTHNFVKISGVDVTILALDFDTTTGLFTPGDGTYTPCPTADYTLRTSY